MPMTLAITITSDFICPWCLIADRRLNRAIDQFNSPVEIQTIWHPFELNPGMQLTGMDRKAYRTKKFGSWQFSQSLDEKTVQAAQADGIKFRYDLMQVTPNTLNAHRLTWLAGQNGKATEIAEGILFAYFTAGQNISEIKVLANVAADIGINRNEAESFLLSENGIHEVKELEQRVIAQGISGVPAICIGQETILGAQPVEVFLAALQITVNQIQVV